MTKNSNRHKAWERFEKFIEMCINRSIILFFPLFLLTNIVYGQDTIRLNKKPKVILHSWYPEYKKFPKIKEGESKVLFTIVPEFKETLIRNNDIDLRTFNNNVKIKETVKRNQYVVTVNSTDAKYIEFEVWLDLGDNIVLINQNGKWKKANEIYKLDGNRLLIDTVKLEVAR